MLLGHLKKLTGEKKEKLYKNKLKAKNKKILKNITL